MKTQRQVRITRQSAIRITVAVAALCSAFVPQAMACGIQTEANKAALRAMKVAPMLAFGTARPAPLAATGTGNQANENSPFITGMWDVTMLTGDVLYDHAFQQLYTDGNEIQYSGLFTPDEGNICFGIWKQVDSRTFKLKHFAFALDGGNIIGLYILTATITVGTPAGPNTYVGSFVADVVLPSGALDPAWHAEGTMQAKRLTVD